MSRPMLLTNALIHPMHARNITYRELLIRNGRIVWGGDLVPEELAKGAVRLDMGGRCVVPGFIDTHTHFSSAGFFSLGLDVRSATTVQEVVDMTAEFCRANPRAKQVLGFGLSSFSVKERRLPTREELDRASPETPVLLVIYDGHSAVVNSKYIERTTMPAETRGFEGGNKLNDKNGYLTRDAFYLAVEEITASVKQLDLLKGVVNGAWLAARNGVTNIHALEGVGFPEDSDVRDVLRISAILPNSLVVYQQTRSPERAASFGLPRMGGCFSMAIDGCFGARDAALLEPYEGTDETGIIYVEQEEFNDIASRAHRLGMQLSAHAIGDRAIETVITGVENALREHPAPDHRHRIEHCYIPNDKQLERIAAAGIYVATQPIFLDFNLEPAWYMESLLGRERYARFAPLRTMHDLGIPVAGGSDAPVSPMAPLPAIQAACQHFVPEQSLDRFEAVSLYTRNAAALAFQDAERGTLTAGKRADFVVLDRDIMEVPLEDVSKLSVEETWIRGRPLPARNPGLPTTLLKLAARTLFSLLAVFLVAACGGTGENIALDQAAQQDSFWDPRDGDEPEPEVTGCTTGEDCDDGNPCTVDECIWDGTCKYSPEPYVECDDDNACTTEDTCTGEGVCVGTPGTVDCDDGNPCTTDTCDPAKSCVFSPADGAGCDDGNLCTEFDVCIDGICTGDEAKCDDGNDCTADGCDFGTGECNYMPQSNYPCDDGNACTNGDICDDGECVPGTLVECDDGVLCTQDTCLALPREDGGGCQHQPAVGLECDDLNLCTEDDQCNEDGKCSGAAIECADEDPCTDDQCNPAEGCYTLPNSGGACDDSDPCTLDGKCQNGQCQTGPPVDCDDGIDCTQDWCGEDGECLHQADDLVCEDGEFCNGAEFCDVAADCQEGLPPEGLDDELDCTLDECDEEGATITHLPQHDLCDDGNLCNGSEVCWPDSGCQAGQAMVCDDLDCCTDDSCDPVDGCGFDLQYDGCKQCTADADCLVECPDGKEPDDPASGLCNPGDDLCATWYCSLTVADCGDGVGKCSFLKKFWDDGNPCTIEICDPDNGSFYQLLNPACCTALTDPPGGSNSPLFDPEKSLCHDDDNCTVDKCDYDTGQCSYEPVACYDGDQCTTDFCAVDQGCQHEPIEQCEYACYNDYDCRADHDNPLDADGLCSVERCSFAVQPLGACVYEPLMCDDGLACTNDWCEDGLGCQYDPNPDCSDAECQDDEDCEDGHACTNNSCIDGLCSVFPVGCDDDDLCTLDWCHPVTGSCMHTSSPLCNQDCNTLGEEVCSDGNACTLDICSPDSGGCLHFVKSCSDLDVCTSDSCDPQTGCVFAPVPDCQGCIGDQDCSDDNACTLDLCKATHPAGQADEAYMGNGFAHPSSYCTHQVVCAPCENDGECMDTALNNACVNSTGCDLETGYCNLESADCDDQDPCTADECNPETGECVQLKIPGCCTDDGGCEDGNPCTGVTCNQDDLLCESSTYLCDDYDPCTADSCDNGCVHAPIELCYDECEKDYDCVFNADPLNLCSQVSCTADPDNGFGKCIFTWMECGDTSKCTTDMCKTELGCQFIPVADCTAPCNEEKECDDANACTADACVAGECLNSATLNCDDGDKCTYDSCNRITGECLNVECDDCECLACEDDAQCDDANACTIDECPGVPGAPGVCLHHAVTCNDGNPCTSDECTPESGCQLTALDHCVGCLADSDCHDGNTCTIDKCDSQGQCLHQLICF